jgi:hypothetical protein
MSWSVGIGIAVAAFLLAVGGVLWSEAGAAIFIETAIAGIVNCI